MLKLFYLPGACSMVPHVALEWTGADYEAEAVPRDKLKTKEFMALSPLGSVPCLLDGEFALTQNVAILEYLHERFPAAKIFATSDNDLPAQQLRADARRWLVFLNADLHKAIAPIFNPARICADSNSHPAIAAQARDNVANLMQVVEARLAQVPFLAGAPSIADVYLAVIMGWSAKTGIDFAVYKHASQLRAQILAQSAVQKVMRAEGLIA